MNAPDIGPDPVRPSGRNQAAMRAYNERLVLTLVRRRGALARSEIARLTGLTPQSTSALVKALEADGLLTRGALQKGRVGQPTVPFTLDPEGAFFLGAKVGRRSFEAVLVDFTGRIRDSRTETYAFPTPDAIIRSMLAAADAHRRLLGGRADRIAGLGLAIPSRIWDWADVIGAPPAAIAAWSGRDIRAELAALLPFPVSLQNDASAACGAELVFGAAGDLSDFLHIFVGTFIGGGVVLNRGLVTGRSGNAGAVGSMPVPDGTGGSVQLLERASLIHLERAIGADRASELSGSDWSRFGAPLDAWIGTAAAAIAHAITSASAVLDFEATIIDGAFPAGIRDRLCTAIGDVLREIDHSGIDLPAIRAGSLGPLARALGGASLPLFERYLVEEGDLQADRSGHLSGRPQTA
jgi:predicted NBD/HSP70 family sugar kinase